MTKIKICGLTSPEDIAAVNTVCPDYIGFVFAPSKRKVSCSQAVKLKALLSPRIQAVGVFVNAPIEEMAALANQGMIDFIQLHGDETDHIILQLKEKTQVPIIKAVRIKTADDFLKAASVPSDYLLFDTFINGTYGGSGHTFDWSMIPNLGRPYFLAGGLNLGNIEAAAQTPAYCLDISSGVETDGCKNPYKIKQIVHTIRTIRRSQP